jgi:hypothetical protein
MRLATLFALLALAGCAGNRAEDGQGAARVRDTTLTSADTLAPGDTLDRARRPVPDTAITVDTTSNR